MGLLCTSYSAYFTLLVEYKGDIVDLIMKAWYEGGAELPYVTQLATYQHPRSKHGAYFRSILTSISFGT